MSEEKKMIITGASGFIGSALAAHFRSRGWSVLAFVQTIPEKPHNGIVYVKYNLAGIPDEGAFENAAVLIHCAYVKNDIETNVAGTKKLLALSRKHDLKRNIFLSSFSAHPDAVTKYGKQKLEIEKMFNTAADCSVRAGVVLGEGGLFGQMKAHLLKRKRIPLISGGQQPMQTIHIDDLVMCIERIVERSISGTYSLAEPVPVPYKELFIAICERLKVPPRFMRVPFFLVNFGLAVAEGIGLKLPVNRENVLGLKFIRARETKADLERLGVTIGTYKESLQKL